MARPPRRPEAEKPIVSVLTIGLFLSLSLGLHALSACSRLSASPAPGGDAGPLPQARDVLDAVARAEDLRRARDLPSEVQADHDPVSRRAAARALARILDPDDRPLLRALEDDDLETSAWAAYGLGESCKGREEAHVRALASRLASLDARSPAASPAADALDPFVVIVRAIGRCGGSQAEPTLRVWLHPGGKTAENAAYALGDLAGRGGLSLESSSALLEAARAATPVAAALYAFSRADDVPPEAVGVRLAAAAREGLGRPGPERIFAVRALGRAGDARAGADLSRVLLSGEFGVAERVEAARALARLPKAGPAALADAIAVLVGEGPGIKSALGGERFSVLVTAVGAATDEAAARAAPSLWSLAGLAPDRDATPGVVRRASALRCTAAEKLARGAWDSDVLRACDLGDGEAGERARLASLDRSPLVHARRAAWVELARSPHVRVREAALAAAASHPELGDAARGELARALSAEPPGVVAAAAIVIQAHPDRAFVLAGSERRAALDPAGPPPSRTPAKELDAAVATALRGALDRSWPDDRVETRVALLDAAVAVGLDEARAYAKTACADANATIRARAAKALTAAGETRATCAAAAVIGAPAPEIGHTLARPVRVVFETDGGKVAVRFDPALAPVAVTRLVALARSGFYTGLAVHRVVPGFVAQLGDRGGDGYGGSGDLLRCETSPVPFAPLDVGVALAGRDTGSSQIFVTLARTPHLDGEYAWVGHAEGDWSALAEGDVVGAVHVEE